MQLVAYGAQDIYLTGNPQITFFKIVYRRHTNFSMEAIEQTFSGSTTTNGQCTSTISRNGDLIHKLYLEIAGGKNWSQTDNPGASFIKNITLEIGGQIIDKHSGLWMETWAELTQPNNNGACNNTNGIFGTLFQRMSLMGGVSGASEYDINTVYIPLQFWFCRNPGLALPLIALQYHEVKINIDHQITNWFNMTTGQFKLWADYIYLDTDERRRFAQVSHEYLIEQVQEQSIDPSLSSNDLNFNHPVKELIWTTLKSKIGDPTDDPKAQAIGDGTYLLKLNGHDRFAPRDYTYFSRVQVHEYHSGAGGLDMYSLPTIGNYNDSIGVYSFALKPEEHQPSGTCNFSRIDSAQLVSTGTSYADKIFAVNYNVLRIMSGMGGLAYSN